MNETKKPGHRGYEIRKTFFGKVNVHYPCPKCGERLQSPLSDAGTADSCPDCGTRFVVPGADAKQSISRNEQAVREKAAQQRATPPAPTPGLDPKVGIEVLKAVKLYIEADILDFKSFIESLVEDFGEAWLKGKERYLESGWRTANDKGWVDSPAGNTVKVIKEAAIPVVSNDEFADGDWDMAHSGLASEAVQRVVAVGMEGIDGRVYGIREQSPGKWQMVSKPAKNADIVYRVDGPENTEARVTKHDKGWAVSLWDKDVNANTGEFRIFQTGPEPIEHARTIIEPTEPPVKQTTKAEEIDVDKTLRKGQSRRAIDSQLMLFDLSETQTQDDTSPSKPAEVPSRKDESSWQSLVVEARDRGQHGKAVELAEQAVREYPRSAWLWRELGGELIEVDRLDEAEQALETALRLDPNAAWLWRRFAALHRKRKDLEQEIESLEKLYDLDVADSNDLTLLGIAYHNHRDLAKAVECYRLSAAAKDTSAPWFNLALVYSDPEISQDADAADACRCALSVAPDYASSSQESTQQKGVQDTMGSTMAQEEEAYNRAAQASARELLEKTKRKLAPLATQAKVGADGLVEPDEFFDFYISPFEMLQIEDVRFAAGPDAKAIKRAKDRLNAELQLNDGKVSWLDDYSLDKARALAVVDELDDEAKWRYHVAIFRNQPLLNFLTRGDIQHFLYSDDYFPCDTEELLHQEPGFRKFLSKPFARQYNRVLTRAIEQQRLAVVEVLFDGRRWVEPEDADLCFEGACKRVENIVEAMRPKAAEGCSCKVGLREMQDFLRERSLPELFNLLPAHFARYQGDMVDELRNLAISCFNQHGDPVLSKGVLSLCKNFTSRNVALTKQLEEDFKTIEAMISKYRQHVLSASTKPSGRHLPNEPTGSVTERFLDWCGVAALVVAALVVFGAIIFFNLDFQQSSRDTPTETARSSRSNPPAFSTPSSRGLTQELVEDLAAALDHGHVALEAASGNGASSGLAVDAYLLNQRNTEVSLDVSLRQPLFLRNRGRGQNMFVIKVYLQGGGYVSDGFRSFISLQPKRRTPVQFIAYCADFDKDNPSKTEELVRDASPVSLLPLLQSISNYQSSHPNLDITTAAQTAIWLAQGVSIEEVRTKFEVNRDQELLAREFLK